MRVPGSVELKVSAAPGAGKWRSASFGRAGTQNLQTSRDCSARDADLLRLAVFGGLLGRSLTWLSLGFPCGSLRLLNPRQAPIAPLPPDPHPLPLPLFDACDTFTECLLRHLGPMPPWDWSRPNKLSLPIGVQWKLNKKGSK